MVLMAALQMPMDAPFATLRLRAVVQQRGCCELLQDCWQVISSQVIEPRIWGAARPRQDLVCTVNNDCVSLGVAQKAVSVPFDRYCT